MSDPGWLKPRYEVPAIEPNREVLRKCLPDLVKKAGTRTLDPGIMSVWS
jgi:hypothetical protein